MTTNRLLLDSPNGHAAADPPPTSWSLTEDEAEVYHLLQQLDRQTFELHVQPLRQRFERFLRRVEARIGLPVGDLTSGRYDLDAETSAVRLRVPAAE